MLVLILNLKFIVKDKNMISNKIKRKFTETIDLSEWEIETDTGWEDIKSIGKTIPYEKWIIRTETYELECADTHIVFDEFFNEIFVKDLIIGSRIMTEYGSQTVKFILNTNKYEEMYDLQLNEGNRRFYTNGILSHNSIWLANFAANAVKLGYNSAVISFEMRDRHVIKRLGANMLNISMKDYNDAAKDKDKIKKLLSNISFDTLTMPGKLFIKEYPTSAASTKDVERYLLKMEERYKFKFKTVFVDYINIIQNWRNPNSENTYMKIKQISEDLRAMAKRNNWALISLTQVNRSAFGASGQLALSSIAESSGLGHTVDWMGGLIQDEVMHANNEYLLQTMLNRNEGYKNSRRRFLIDYNHMRLTEDPNTTIIQENI